MSLTLRLFLNILKIHYRNYFHLSLYFVSGDLKPRFEKKVKSESGCFSGSEDTENKDPFTKPSSKPKLRREIPKPEIRTRKHLSTSN